MKISIITIVYNNSKSIKDCIESVANQSYNNIEYIIIDGGSKDGTLEIIQNYSDNIDCFISETDNGLYNALNKGISHATGDIIGILHSDDVFYNREVLVKISQKFMESNVDLIYGKGYYIKNESIKKVVRIYKSSPFKKWYVFFGWIPLHTTIFVRKEIFEKYGLYKENYHISGDYEISLRWFCNDSINKKYLDEWIVKMTIGGKSTNVKLQQLKSFEDLDIIKRYNLWGMFTLFCKIVRKIPQYITPYFRGVE